MHRLILIALTALVGCVDAPDVETETQELRHCSAQWVVDARLTKADHDGGPCPSHYPRLQVTVANPCAAAPLAPSIVGYPEWVCTYSTTLAAVECVWASPPDPAYVMRLYAGWSEMIWPGEACHFYFAG